MLLVSVRPFLGRLRDRVGPRAASGLSRRLAYLRRRLICRSLAPARQSTLFERRDLRQRDWYLEWVDGGRPSRALQLRAGAGAGQPGSDGQRDEKVAGGGAYWRLSAFRQPR